MRTFGSACLASDLGYPIGGESFAGANCFCIQGTPGLRGRKRVGEGHSECVRPSQRSPLADDERGGERDHGVGDDGRVSFVCGQTQALQELAELIGAASPCVLPTGMADPALEAAQADLPPDAPPADYLHTGYVPSIDWV